MYSSILTITRSFFASNNNIPLEINDPLYPPRSDGVGRTQYSIIIIIIIARTFPLFPTFLIYFYLFGQTSLPLLVKFRSQSFSNTGEKKKKQGATVSKMVSELNSLASRRNSHSPSSQQKTYHLCHGMDIPNILSVLPFKVPSKQHLQLPPHYYSRQPANNACGTLSTEIGPSSPAPRDLDQFIYFPPPKNPEKNTITPCTHSGSVSPNA